MGKTEAVKQFVTVSGKSMAYVEEGSGEAVLFLHGNPASSYLWRDVIPPVARHFRCFAPDLVGMGDSEKLESPGADTYRFDVHADFVADFIDAIIPAGPIHLVVHDWGSALGFDWAFGHRDRVASITYMEAIVRPMAGWDEWNAQSAPIFQGFRSDAGEQLILERNLFIEKVLPGSILRKLTEAEMEEYRRPFLVPEHRWPMLTWPRQIPIAGEPPEIVERVGRYSDWMTVNDIPKLFVDAEPGAILIGANRDYCRRWRNQREVKVAGSHFIQEDSGPLIGAAIADFLTGLPQSGAPQ